MTPCPRYWNLPTKMLVIGQTKSSIDFLHTVARANVNHFTRETTLLYPVYQMARMIMYVHDLSKDRITVAFPEIDVSYLYNVPVIAEALFSVQMDSYRWISHIVTFANNEHEYNSASSTVHHPLFIYVQCLKVDLLRRMSSLAFSRIATNEMHEEYLSYMDALEFMHPRLPAMQNVTLRNSIQWLMKSIRGLLHRLSKLDPDMKE